LTSTEYNPISGPDKHFDVSVLDQPISISGSLLPGSALYPGAGAAQRPQKYCKNKNGFNTKIFGLSTKNSQTFPVFLQKTLKKFRQNVV
jgi:hypothetical protein